jgi:hypothetical protein
VGYRHMRASGTEKRGGCEEGGARGRIGLTPSRALPTCARRRGDACHHYLALLEKLPLTWRGRRSGGRALLPWGEKRVWTRGSNATNSQAWPQWKAENASPRNEAKLLGYTPARSEVLTGGRRSEESWGPTCCDPNSL